MLSPLGFCLHAEFRPPTGWCCTREYYLDQTFSYTKRDSEIKERSILPILHLIQRLLFKLKKNFLEQRLNLSFIPPRLTSSPHVPVCLIFLHLFTKIIAMKDKYFSKTKMVCRPLWLTATLKARNFPPNLFVAPENCHMVKPAILESLHWCIVVQHLQDQSFCKQTLNEEVSTESQSRLKWQTSTSTHAWFNANRFPVPGCHQCLWEQAGIIDTAHRLMWLATVARKITHHQHIREIHQHTGWKRLCLHSG